MVNAMFFWLQLVTLPRGRGCTMITMGMSTNTQLIILSESSAEQFHHLD